MAYSNFLLKSILNNKVLMVDFFVIRRSLKFNKVIVLVTWGI
ncbi:hypothetical protein Cp4436_00546 [Clostridium perfringens]|uniref:Uncharacterized protein n=1 Tax=Clostridium perfringens E str. JGS1987 TaxID=451755 RepID=B1BQE5_CLOPF|nr:hypothetical protein AC3_1202 [Clostridium perfringens E str. JGS1987]MDG6888532.1 hypothetical protein [Clostridium perfringens]